MDFHVAVSFEVLCVLSFVCGSGQDYPIDHWRKCMDFHVAVSFEVLCVLSFD